MSDYTPEIYEDDDGNRPFVKYYTDLPPAKQLLLEQTIQGPLSLLGLDICRDPKHGKQLGDGVFEVKTEASENEVIEFFTSRELPIPDGVGGDVKLRTFCHAFGEKRILLLNGYDKGLDPKPKRQQKEIGKAKKHLKAWRESQKRQKAADRKRPPTAADLAARAKAALQRTFAVWIEKFKKSRR